MKSTKVDSIKEKSKSKTPCSSKQASKFLEKEGYNGLSLSFKGLAVSLSDFIPEQNDFIKGSNELDFDIAKQMKKLEKKDVGTKQKALMELNSLLNTKNVDQITGMLRYWPKLYNKLSVDEDKKIRELTQEMMSNIARLCGKSLAPHIKQFLPTWIFAQSDIHIPAAMLAFSSFEKTFPGETRQQKAYLLCWTEISEMISFSLMRAPPINNKDNLLESKRNEDMIVIKETEDSVGSDKGKALKHQVSLPCATEVHQTEKGKISLDTYSNDIVLHLRTLTTLLPHITENQVAIEDLKKWLQSKNFWAHYKATASTNIISIYLTLCTKLMIHVPQIVLETPFILGHISQSLRFIDNYHSTIVPLVWSTILKCTEVLGDKLWKHVSFSGTFLPKWLKMLECAVDGRMSLAGSFMLPFFTKMPLDLSSGDSLSTFCRIFDAMTMGLLCHRVRNNSHEANCVVTTILECTTFTILGARANNNDQLKEKVFSIIWRTIENYLSDAEYSKADKTITLFCAVALRPLVNKDVVSSSQFIDIVSAWIEKYHHNSLFSQNFAELISTMDEMNVSDDRFCHTFLEAVQVILINKVIHNQVYLLPYLSIVASQRSIPQTSDNHAQLKDVFIHCKDIVGVYNPPVMKTIAVAMANILNNLPDDSEHLYNTLLLSLTSDQTRTFFKEYYLQFLTKVNENVCNIVTSKSLSVWKCTLLKELNGSLEENNSDVPILLKLVVRICSLSSVHRSHISSILHVIEAFVSNSTKTSLTHDYIDLTINILKFCIDELNTHFSLNLLSRSIVLNFVKILLSISKDATAELPHLRLYLQRGSNEDASVFREVLDEVLCSYGGEYEVAADIVAMTLMEAPDALRSNVFDHLSHILLNDMVAMNNMVGCQRRYSSSILQSQQDKLIGVMYRINVLLHLPFDSNETLGELKEAVAYSCVLLTPVILSTFSNCHYSANLLQQCESIYKYSESVIKEDLLDLMLISLQCADSGLNAIIDGCHDLVLMAVTHFMPTNYSQWTHSLQSSVDIAINSWAAADLSQSQNQRQTSLIFEVLIPGASRARYLVQEVMLASISSLIGDDGNPSLANINRVIHLMKSLSAADSSFFSVCFPILLSVKDQFESHIDQLYDATVDGTVPDGQFNLSSLLDFLIIGVDNCSTAFDHNQWDFVLCIVGTLSRSAQFINSGDFFQNSVSGNRDQIFNSVLLLRLIASVTVSLASVHHEAVLDEWDNFFSEPIFTAILDMFSLVSGDHTRGKLVSSDIFVFYTEALADVVSLCPIAILLGHNFQSQIHINDPIDLPKDFLLVLNSLLDSLSSYSLSTQLAAYNCLVNLNDNLSNLLLEQISKAEVADTLESFSITFPHKLICYLQSDDLIHLSVDKIENEVVLTRCFLAWNILFNMFSSSQAKVRAEISSFLATHDRVFDKFLSFCFTFMPKSPIVNKRSLSFLAVQGRQSCNLIADEPQIFSRCLDRRTKFIIYHLSSYVFRRAVQVLPNMARCWFLRLESTSQQQVDAYIRQYISPEIIKCDFDQLKESVKVDDDLHGDDQRLQIEALSMIGEVTVRYVVPGDQCLEQLINVPSNYPIGKVTVDFKKELKVNHIAHWKSWIIQMTSTMQNQNGSILDGVRLWKKNLDEHFDGVEECMICYSILHAIKYTMPSMRCRQCKKKFHKDCMHKWFQSSTNPTCPNCRNVFYDGTYKRTSALP